MGLRLATGFGGLKSTYSLAPVTAYKSGMWQLVNGCPLEFVTIRRIMENPGCPSRSCHNINALESLNFWFIIAWDSIGLIVV